jgi:hypothetical protein
MIRLSDICPGRCTCTDSDPESCRHQLDCSICGASRCSCGLPWRHDRDPHTLTGIVLTDEVVARILAREGELLAVDERREREREEIRDSLKLAVRRRA